MSMCLVYNICCAGPKTKAAQRSRSQPWFRSLLFQLLWLLQVMLKMKLDLALNLPRKTCSLALDRPAMRRHHPLCWTLGTWSFLMRRMSPWWRRNLTFQNLWSNPSMRALWMPNTIWKSRCRKLPHHRKRFLESIVLHTFVFCVFHWKPFPVEFYFCALYTLRLWIRSAPGCPNVCCALPIYSASFSLNHPNDQMSFDPILFIYFLSMIGSWGLVRLWSWDNRKHQSRHRPSKPIRPWMRCLSFTTTSETFWPPKFSHPWFL